ncbi:type VII toxin-antitoxin system MntA family adenylyltransferase antitoxin [Pseudalkalibacillus decolorationis]|uniref:type VII toxin-antitoxin system MntA family adenylyltransferase antitoxin n=1 Tax=Pseudalkalibacillus decolorationis TaxID=163879 RepID=UPI002147986F|nr:nucleotidyltransferase domain-containing protein [Pseudalkalibacillus decolorationis]
MNENIEKIIVDVLVEKLSPFLILLFGSTVKRNTHSESDIDIAFLNDNTKFDKYEVFMIAQELATELNRDVDLIDLNQASTVFQAQILHTGNIIYCTDEQKKANYEMKTFKMYTRLNEERAEILKKIDESGSIHE